MICYVTVIVQIFRKSLAGIIHCARYKIWNLTNTDLDRQYTMPHFPGNCSLIRFVMSAVNVDGFLGSTRNLRFGRLKL